MDVSKIIWQTPAGIATDFEEEYLTQVLFKYINADSCFDNAGLLVKQDNSVVVYSSNAKHISHAFKKYLLSVKNFILCHLSNESLNHKSEYYKYANAVLRSYFDPLKIAANVFFIPLGFKSGFHNKIQNKINLSDRNYNWAFAGQLKNHRKQMLEGMKNIPSDFIYITSRWNAHDQLSVNEIIEIYKHTIFIPCPFGSVNPDSFRIMEALEYGCIPVVVKYKGIDYYKYIFGDHPFIIGNTWVDAIQQMNQLLDKKNVLQTKTEIVQEWYIKFKENLSVDIRSILSQSEIKPLVSKQFYYQQAAKYNLKLRYIFWKEFYFKKSKVNFIYKRIKNRLLILSGINLRYENS